MAESLKNEENLRDRVCLCITACHIGSRFHWSWRPADVTQRDSNSDRERATRSEHLKCELIKTAGKMESGVTLPWQLTVHGDKGYTSSPARRRSEATRAAKRKHKHTHTRCQIISQTLDSVSHFS